MSSPVKHPDPNDEIRDEAVHLSAKVKTLPDHIFKTPSPYPLVVQYALVESFHVAVRALIEFLLIRPTGRPTDVHAASLIPGWAPKLTQAKSDELIKHWNIVSAQLVHFSSARTQPVDAVEAEVRQLAADVLAVWDQLAADSQHPQIPAACDIDIFDETALGGHP